MPCGAAHPPWSRNMAGGKAMVELPEVRSMMATVAAAAAAAISRESAASVFPNQAAYRVPAPRPRTLYVLYARVSRCRRRLLFV